ncbi:MAG: hypothetical protein U9M89_00470 [Patescibacteria group bacterium]|nr:hypothetical protein [Patescibacteria group bacterium]
MFLGSLWNYRKLILLGVILLALLEVMYFWPKLLVWMVIAAIVVTVIFTWWINNSKFSLDLAAFMAESVWAVLAGIGFLIFARLGFWQAHLTVLVILTMLAFVVFYHQNRIDNKQWSLSAINWLSSIDLLILFIATLSLMLLPRFYGIDIFWLMLLVSAQLVLAFYLFSWRQGLPMKKFWLHSLLLALIGQEIIWVTSAWYKNAYFKAFLLLIIYYLYSELIVHYAKGNLTVRVAVEYILIAFTLIVALFVFDWLFVLAPNIL